MDIVLLGVAVYLAMLGLYVIWLNARVKDLEERLNDYMGVPKQP